MADYTPLAAKTRHLPPPPARDLAEWRVLAGNGGLHAIARQNMPIAAIVRPCPPKHTNNRRFHVLVKASWCSLLILYKNTIALQTMQSSAVTVFLTELLLFCQSTHFNIIVFDFVRCNCNLTLYCNFIDFESFNTALRNVCSTIILQARTCQTIQV